MTIPSERTRATIYALEFLQDLLDPKKTPKVPKSVRQRAARVLRHYPRPLDLDLTAVKLPTLWVRVTLEDNSQ